MAIKEKIELSFFIVSHLYIIYIVKKAIRNNETQNTDSKS
jgi:hypothetical protein